MMRIEKYCNYLESHRELMQLLYSSRRMPFHDYQLPAIGFIALKNEIPIAAGFLRQVEGMMGFFDSFITNKDSLSGDKDEALKFIIQNLIDTVRNWKWKSILCFTAHESLFQRSLEIGFTPMQWSCSTFNLEDV